MTVNDYLTKIRAMPASYRKLDLLDGVWLKHGDTMSPDERQRLERESDTLHQTLVEQDRKG